MTAAINGAIYLKVSPPNGRWEGAVSGTLSFLCLMLMREMDSFSEYFVPRFLGHTRDEFWGQEMLFPLCLGRLAGWLADRQAGAGRLIKNSEWLPEVSVA